MNSLATIYMNQAKEVGESYRKKAAESTHLYVKESYIELAEMKEAEANQWSLIAK